VQIGPVFSGQRLDSSWAAREMLVSPDFLARTALVLILATFWRERGWQHWSADL